MAAQTSTPFSYEAEEHSEVQGQYAPLAWTRPATEGILPCVRGGHTTVAAQGKFVMFGGHVYSASGTFEYFNDVYTLSMTTMRWKKVRVQGDIAPEPRYGHTATLIGSRMFIFGGRGQNKQIFKDIWFLDLDTWTWKAVQSPSNPPPERFMHSEVAVGNKIVYFGGVTQGQKTLDDLWVFDTERFHWIRPRTAGKPPSKRHGHVCHLTDDGRIFIHGGADIGPRGLTYLNDFMELDTETMVWTRPRVTGDSIPGPRHYHCTAKLGNYMILYGGWTPKKINVLPEFIKDANEQNDGSGSLAAGQNRCDYLYVLDTENMEWHRPNYVGTCPAKRYGTTMAFAGTHLFIIGGWDGTRPLNDTVVLEFPSS